MRLRVYFMLCFLGMFIFVQGSDAIYAYECINDDLVQYEKIYDDWYNDDYEIEFPLNVEDEEWKNIGNVVDMRAVSQIPDVILESISTEDLLVLIEEYPLGFDLYAYETLSEGYEQIKSQFNGIEEFLSRDDAYNVLINEYEDFNIPSERIFNCDDFISEENYVEDFNALLQDEDKRELIVADARISYTINILEQLMMDIATNDEYDAIVETYNNKLSQKLSSEYYNENTAIQMITCSDNVNNKVVSEVAESMSFQNVSQTATTSTYTVYTPSGTPVVCTYSPNLNMVNASEYAGLYLSYNASVVSSASTTYNCHSFAWLQDSYPNLYQHLWLNIPTAFTDDKKYKSESSPSKAGRIACWGAHSGIVIELASPNPENHNIPEPVIISKWADGPIIRHLVTSCPYYKEGSVIKYYFRYK